MRVCDRRDAAERFVVGDYVGLGGVEVVDRGSHVPGVPHLDRVDEDLEAQRVSTVVVFVGRDLRAGADHEVPAQGVQGLALVELPVDPGAEHGIGAVAQQEVGADDPAVLPERDSKRGLGRGILQAGDQQARRDPATLQRRGRAQQIVVLLNDPLRPGPRSQHGVDGQAGGHAEEVEPEIAGVSEARDEAESKEIEQREHELGRAVGFCPMKCEVWV